MGNLMTRSQPGLQWARRHERKIFLHEILMLLEWRHKNDKQMNGGINAEFWMHSWAKWFCSLFPTAPVLGEETWPYKGAPNGLWGFNDMTGHYVSTGFLFFFSPLVRENALFGRHHRKFCVPVYERQKVRGISCWTGVRIRKLQVIQAVRS